VVDRWGNAFSATPSDGSWASPVIPGLGIIPSNRGSQSRPDPTHPCGVAPGKRPRLTPNPAMIVTKGGGVMPFGTPGGDVQIQAMVQVVLNILQHGMEVQEAIEAPRVASYSFPSSFAPFEYFPGRLAVEGAIPQATRDALAAKGHGISDWPAQTWLAGTVEVVMSDPAKGLLAAGYPGIGHGYDMMVLHALGLDPEAVRGFIAGSRPTYPQFEAWIAAQPGVNLTKGNIHKLNVSIAGYIHAADVRTAVLAANGLPDDGSVLPDAISLNNLDDWFEFHQAVLK
jgi:hypothetical protein